MADIQEYVGCRVSVYSGEWPRSEGFPTGISVNGELEYNPERDQYRVLFDSGLYAYFNPEDEIETRAGEDVGRDEFTFSDGAEALIRIRTQS